MLKSELYDFLNGTNKESDNGKKKAGRKAEGDSATHTGMTGGAWRIDDDDMDEFYKLYCKYINHGHGALHMTEKSTRIGAMRVDLDFRYEGRIDDHLHTQEQVVNFVKAYMDEVKKFLVVSEGVEIFVSEKPEPTLYPAGSEKNKTSNDYSKSGLHVVIPVLKTNHFVEEEIRRTLVKRMDEFFPGLPLADKWDKVYDEGMLSHTKPWTLPGSKKKEGTPYQIKYILDWDPSTGEISVDDDVPVQITPDLLRKMSIRSSPSTETPMTEDATGRYKKKTEQEEVRASMGAQRGRSGARGVEEGKRGSRASTPERNTYRMPLSEDMVAYYRKHVMNLAAFRYTSYEDWINTGICLKNIHPDSLEAVFYDFSAQYNDYDPRLAQSKWDSFSFRTNGPVLSERSLRGWSRMDNPGEYDKIEMDNVEELVEEATKTMTEHDMARVVFAMFRDEFKCSDYGQNEWYRFVGHVWKLTRKGVGLLAKLSSDVWKKFVEKENKMQQLMMVTDPCNCGGKKKGEEPAEPCEMCKIEKRKAKYMEAQKKLKTTAFKKNVMEEARLLFLDEELSVKLDTNKNLIAFDNGIFDTLNMEFRDGKSEDYLSFSTGLDYHKDKHYTEYACWTDLWKFLSSILPDPEVLNYFMAHLATCMVGGNPAQKFHILTGSGSNGKSMLVILMATCMGTYACKAPITLITQDRGKAGTANPELVRMKGKRFVTMQEPEEGANIKTGLMKELSSCEKITARDLFAGAKEMIDIEIQAKYHVSCNNKPKVDTQDGGTWRRLLVIDFPNKFVPNPTAPNELPDDKTIQMKVESVEWAECMMNYLVTIFKEGHGFRKLPVPEKVTLSTSEYKSETDVIGRFISEFIHPLDADEKVADTKLTITQMNADFQRWKQNNSISQGSTAELKKRMEATYTKYPNGGWDSFRYGFS
jgi:P4 family phage/plasmid primase-like protien